MNIEVKKLWLEALRSGEYKQDKGYLRTINGFCCLGVLCDLYAKEFDERWHYVDIQEGYYSLDSACRMLPSKVIKWAGLTMANPVVIRSPGLEEDVTLASMNDHGAPFHEIADMIEEKL